MRHLPLESQAEHAGFADLKPMIAGQSILTLVLWWSEAERGIVRCQLCRTRLNESSAMKYACMAAKFAGMTTPSDTILFQGPVYHAAGILLLFHDTPYLTSYVTSVRIDC